MDKKDKILIAVIVIIAVLVIGVLSYQKIFNKDVNQDESVENEIEENVVQNEMVEDNIIVDDPVIDEEPSNTEITTSVQNQANTVYQSDKVYESNSAVGTTNKKEEAINLVKQEWGEDSTVTFSCDSVTTNGEYIIAVTSLETATVKSYFRVNLENKTVTVEF